VADEFYIVHQGAAAAFDGDLEDYAKWLVEADSAAPEPADRKPETTESRRQRKREEAERRNRLSPLRAAIVKCEGELERLARERSRVQAALEAPDIYADGEKGRLGKLLEEQAQLARATEAAEGVWLEATERLESQLRKLSAG